jgi:integrase
MGDLHVVPLARQAVVVLRELHRRLGYTKEQMTAHGFRSMASPLLNEQGFHPDLIALQLAHAVRNKVRAAYNKAQRLAERRKMMQTWADYIDSLRTEKDTNIQTYVT